MDYAVSMTIVLEGASLKDLKDREIEALRSTMQAEVESVVADLMKAGNEGPDFRRFSVNVTRDATDFAERAAGFADGEDIVLLPVRVDVHGKDNAEHVLSWLTAEETSFEERLNKAVSDMTSFDFDLHVQVDYELFHVARNFDVTVLFSVSGVPERDFVNLSKRQGAVRVEDFFDGKVHEHANDKTIEVKVTTSFQRADTQVKARVTMGSAEAALQFVKALCPELDQLASEAQSWLLQQFPDLLSTPVGKEPVRVQAEMSPPYQCAQRIEITARGIPMELANNLTGSGVSEVKRHYEELLALQVSDIVEYPEDHAWPEAERDDSGVKIVTRLLKSGKIRSEVKLATSTVAEAEAIANSVCPDLATLERFLQRYLEAEVGLLGDMSADPDQEAREDVEVEAKVAGCGRHEGGILTLIMAIHGIDAEALMGDMPLLAKFDRAVRQAVGDQLHVPARLSKLFNKVGDAPDIILVRMAWSYDTDSAGYALRTRLEVKEGQICMAAVDAIRLASSTEMGFFGVDVGDITANYALPPQIFDGAYGDAMAAIVRRERGQLTKKTGIKA